MDSSNPIVFYDIASGPPKRTYAPNPWKTRYALNIKQAHYRTSWVELLDVKKTRLELGVAPNRTLPDGSDFYTLPVIQDPSNNNEIVGDSFDIALYLDKQLPSNGPRLFPPSTTALQAALNIQVDAIFTNRVLLFVHGMPFNPETAAETKKSFEARTSGLRWSDMGVHGEARTKMFADLKGELAAFARKVYRRRDEGPFLEGKEPIYGDLIVAAWLQYAKATVSEEEWSDVCSWDDGLWGGLIAALEPFVEIK